MSDTIAAAYPNVRSKKYIIVESRVLCLHCNVVTSVFALALPADYESLNATDDTPDDVHGTWESPGLPAVLSYVEYVQETVASRIRALTTHYRSARDRDSGQTFWINHCQHCGAQLEEEELHGEPDCPFSPNPCEGLEAVRRHEIHEPFKAWAGGESHAVIPLDG
jgi:hypothetical protein